jgi:GNAT superfamily N-acetyltransferase
MTDANITYYRLEDHHMMDVQYLFWAVFRKKVTLDYLRMKYATAYAGAKYICSIAYDGNLPIAFYGALPQRFVSKDTPILAAHACDSFTLKNYQGKGIHYNLALHAYEIMKASNVKFVYAFHSDNTYHSTKKLGWLTHHPMQRFHIKTTTFPLAKLYKKIGLAGFHQKKIAALLKPYESKKNIAFHSHFAFHQAFNNDFLTYKNGFFPHFWIELYDCQFLVKVDALLQIGFFNYSSFENLLLAIKQLKKLCVKMGVTELLFQVTADSGMSSALQKITAPQPSWLIGYLPFEEINLSEFEFTFADLDTF